jgi:biotin-dependent carboxylase-like uncharacterized protein
MSSVILTILNGGAHTTLQDAGRPGFRHLGIPRSGAADRLSFGIANFLVGNSWDAPALECTLGGLHLRFEKDTRIAISGAEMWAQINGLNIEMNRSLPVKKGDILTFSFARIGCRAYIAVEGGLEGESFLQSVSTYTPAKLGGLEGRRYKAGDEIRSADLDNTGPQSLPTGYTPILSRHIVLRARSVSEWERLSPNAQRYMFTSPFITTQDTDRMGARLIGDQIDLLDASPLVSGPILPGTLQIPPDGKPILAMIDGHCTGGYARALQVISADIWLLGQIAPGSPISFRRCFVEEATDILQGRNAFYAGLIPGFHF